MGEKAWGALFILIAIILIGTWICSGIALYTYGENALLEWTMLFGALPFPPILWLMWFVLLVAILLVSIIFGWVGVSLIKTPSLEEIDVEELEKEIEEEAKKIEEEIKREEEGKSKE